MSDAEGRNLTDKDVEAIVGGLWARGKDEFYRSLGKGLFAMLLAALSGLLLFVAILGADLGDKAS